MIHLALEFKSLLFCHLKYWIHSGGFSIHNKDFDKSDFQTQT